MPPPGPIRAGSVMSSSGYARIPGNPAVAAGRATRAATKRFPGACCRAALMPDPARPGARCRHAQVPARCRYLRPCRSRNWLGREPK